VLNTPIVEYEGEQLTLNLDVPEFSICPNCAGEIINLADGCSLCGWSGDGEILLGGQENSPLHENKKRSSLPPELSIPCLIHRPKQPQLKGVIRQDLGDSFVVYIPSDKLLRS